jgi:hypothetical protein
MGFGSWAMWIRQAGWKVIFVHISYRVSFMAPRFIDWVTCCSCSTCVFLYGLPGAADAPKPGAADPPKPGAADAPKPGAADAPMPGAADPPKPGAADAPMPGAADPPKPGAADAPMPGAADAPMPGAADPPKPGAADAPKPVANDFLKSCQDIIEKLEDLMKSGRSSQEYLMNENQCRFLVKRLSGTLADFPHSSHPDEKTSLVIQELRYIFEDAQRLIQSCCIKSTASNSERLLAAIEHGDMKHTFAKLLYDVEWHAYVLQSILENSGVPRTTFEAAKCRGDLILKDNAVLEHAKIEDDKILTNCLKSLTLDCELERDLADQLLKHSELQAESSDCLGHAVLRLREDEMKEHLHGERQPLGSGAFGEVQALKFLGGSLAVKFISQSRSHEVEVKAMQGLGHHPNIVRLYCSSRNNEECVLIMEKMDGDLDCILRNKKRICIEVSLVEKVVLMLEIAEGMRYMHKMRMAHRDLKPSNVLVNLENSSRAYSVKIADFGLTKTKEASRTYKDQTTNLGTSKYMAPEMISFVINEKGEFNPTKADVYSFGIMCFEILTGQSAFGEIKNWRAFKKDVKENGNFRPDLQQGSGPLRLESLIERCWDDDRHSRPDFDRICTELRYIKGLLLRGAFLMCCIFLNITHSHTNLMLQYLLAINMQS